MDGDGWDSFHELKSAFNAVDVMKIYEKHLKAHPYYNKYIAHTPMENDCVAMAWTTVKEILETL